MRVVRPVVVVAALAFAGGPISAQTVTYVEQERRVYAFSHETVYYDDPYGEEEVTDREEFTAPDFGDFDASARASAADFSGGYVSQRSVMRSDGINASGSMGGSTGLDGSYRWETVVTATFDLTGAPARYALTYAIDELTTPYYRHNDFVLARVSPVPSTILDFDVPHEWDIPVTAGFLSGVLDPGRYEFRYRDETLNDIGLSGEYDWSFRLTPVPEPGAAVGVLIFATPALLRRRPPVR
jgi:hypothetical protein